MSIHKKGCFKVGDRKNIYDLVFYANGKGNLKIVYTHTGAFSIVNLNQFSGKQYDYNEIVWRILHNYPNGISVQITSSAKRQIKKQAAKNSKANYG